MSSSLTDLKKISLYCARLALSFGVRCQSHAHKYQACGTYQRKTPTLSTWEVARKSPVGEKETLVATVCVLNPSMSRPDGISKVRMIESRDVVTSHRESGENVCTRSIIKPECMDVI